MAYYPRTPRMATPRMAPQHAPVLYASVSNTPYQSHHPQLYHVAASEPSYPRGRHRSSSRSRDHKRSHSSSGGHRHRRHRSSTPSRSIPPHYSPAAQYASTPSTRHRRHSYAMPTHQHPTSRRDPYGRPPHHGHPDYHHLSYREESIGDRIKRFFGINTHNRVFVNRSGHQVDRYGRPIYAL